MHHSEKSHAFKLVDRHGEAGLPLHLDLQRKVIAPDRCSSGHDVKRVELNVQGSISAAVVRRRPETGRSRRAGKCPVPRLVRADKHFVMSTACTWDGALAGAERR